MPHHDGFNPDNSDLDKVSFHLKCKRTLTNILLQTFYVNNFTRHIFRINLLSCLIFPPKCLFLLLHNNPTQSLSKIITRYSPLQKSFVIGDMNKQFILVSAIFINRDRYRLNSIHIITFGWLSPPYGLIESGGI